MTERRLWSCMDLNSSSQSVLPLICAIPSHFFTMMSIHFLILYIEQSIFCKERDNVCKWPGTLPGLSRSAINEDCWAHHAIRAMLLGQIRAWNSLDHQNEPATNPNICELAQHAI